MLARTKTLQAAPDSTAQAGPASPPSLSVLQARPFRAIALTLVVAAALAGCEQDIATTAQTLAMGQRVYDAQCAACHGAGLEGQPDWRTRSADGKLPAPPHDASGHTWHHPDQALFEIVKYGVQRFAGADYRSDMPAYEGRLSDDEIRAVIAYIKSTWPEQIRAKQAQIDSQAARRP